MLVMLPVTWSFEQLVGLNAKPGRLMLTSTRRRSIGMPAAWPFVPAGSRNVGNGSETSVACAVSGSILIDWRTTTFPR